MSRAPDLERAALQAAKAGRLDPPEGDLLDSALYVTFYHLYAAYLAGHLPKPEAAAAKQRILRDYHTERRLRDLSRRMYDQAAERERRCEAALCAYGREPSAEHADQLFRAMTGQKPKGVPHE